jgi:hypothetical protein
MGRWFERGATSSRAGSFCSDQIPAAFSFDSVDPFAILLDQRLQYRRHAQTPRRRYLSPGTPEFCLLSPLSSPRTVSAPDPK